MSATTTPKTPTPPTLPPGVTKTCHIVKRPDFDGYGFNLHSEKVKPGQFIGKVDASSPAESAGLKEGDRILEVNGVSIGSETHKQVVARIKAIANEVRLLLIDVDGKAIEMPAKAEKPVAECASPALPASTNGNSSPPCYEGTKQEIPGASANISSISVTSMKRVSNASSIQSGSTMNAGDMDVVDRGMPQPPAPVVAPVEAPMAAQNGNKSPSSNSNNSSSNSSNNNNNNNNNIGGNNKMMMSTPPPPSATVANMNNNGSVYNTNNTNGSTNVNGNGTATPPSATMPTPVAPNNNRAGSLNLPTTAAEMRAKLASKKKYDPKNESVDLKKKFEIIQKL